MAQLLASNVTGSLNVTGVVSVNASPLTNTTTQVETGLANFLTANVQTTSVITSTNVLSCTFNETGIYDVTGLILLGFNKATSNASNLGLNVAIGGTATINVIQYSFAGKANGTTQISNLSTTTAQTVIIPNSSGSIANSTNATDYLILSGSIKINAVGTINLQLAAANTLNGNVNVGTNSFVLYTKIG